MTKTPQSTPQSASNAAFGLSGYTALLLAAAVVAAGVIAASTPHTLDSVLAAFALAPVSL